MNRHFPFAISLLASSFTFAANNGFDIDTLCRQSSRVDVKALCSDSSFMSAAHEFEPHFYRAVSQQPTDEALFALARFTSVEFGGPVLTYCSMSSFNFPKRANEHIDCVKAKFYRFKMAFSEAYKEAALADVFDAAKELGTATVKSESMARNRLEQLLHCMSDKADELDDKISSARDIGSVVASVCRPTAIDFTRLVANMSGGGLYPFAVFAGLPYMAHLAEQTADDKFGTTTGAEIVLKRRVERENSRLAAEAKAEKKVKKPQKKATVSS